MKSPSQLPLLAGAKFYLMNPPISGRMISVSEQKGRPKPPELTHSGRSTAGERRSRGTISLAYGMPTQSLPRMEKPQPALC